MELLEETRIFTVGSMFSLKSFDGPDMAKVLKRAKELGVITCSDTGGDHYGLGLKGVASCLENLDYFIPSEYEIRALTGEQDIEKNADILLGMGVKNVCIKLGRLGCFIKNKDGAKRVRTYLVKPIDTTGSGDNFVAGFLSAVLEGKNLEECAARGNACGSINSTKLGATGAVKSLDQVLEFMKVTPYEPD
jgi:sugar/nucleoside kinase (ribokinase family)